MFYNENPKGKVFHVYNRGVDKRKIFMQDSDYSCFLWTLQVRNKVVSCESNRYVSILAYCLMPNHYHLLVEELFEGGLAMFMSRVGNSYTKTFNSKYRRAGRLFESRYKSVNVLRDNQLTCLVDYIHQNPVRAGLVERDVRYKWSSSREFMFKLKGLCSRVFTDGYYKMN